MLLEILTGGGIAAISSAVTQIISEFSKNKNIRFEKKSEKLMRAQEELLKVFDKFLPIFPSFDIKEIIARCELDNTQIDDIDDEFSDLHQEYMTIIHIFLKYRHNFDEKVRIKCDLYFKNIQQISKKAKYLSDLKSFSLPEKKDFLLDFRIFSCLVFLGVVLKLESISKELG